MTDETKMTLHLQENTEPEPVQWLERLLGQIEAAEATARNIERHLARSDFDASEQARLKLLEARRWLRLALAEIEEARVACSVEATPESFSEKV